MLYTVKNVMNGKYSFERKCKHHGEKHTILSFNAKMELWKD